MKLKWLLYVGILLLTAGIFIKNGTVHRSTGLIVMFSGIALKVTYILAKIIRKEYRPGYEFLVLLIGLAIFMTGIYLRNSGSSPHYGIFMIVGICLKVAFVILFIVKSKAKFN